jgi:DHA3 family macrolide efflux protein-like MFS transporter
MRFKKKEESLWLRQVSAFLFGQGVSLFGSQIVQMAILWYVALDTSSGIWVTILTLAAYLPQMIMSLFAGVWADRYNRKRVIIVSDTIIASTTLLLALYMINGSTGEASLTAIFIVSVIRSLGSGIQTPTVNAMLPQLVPEESLMRINSINGTIQSVVQFVSPIAAGAIMVAGPIYNLLFIDVATAMIGIGILVCLRIPKHQSTKRAGNISVFTEMKEGLKFTWNHRFLRQLLATYGAYIFLCVPSGFLTVLIIERTFGHNVLFLSVNETVGFVGALIGGLLLSATGGFKNRNTTFVLGVMLYGITSFAVGFTNVFWLFAALMFFIGMTIPAAQTAVFTLVQEKVEPYMMGRVFSLVNVMFTGFMPLGMAIFGPLADVVRIQTMVIICAVFIMILGISILLSKAFYRQGIRTESTNEPG